LFAGTGKKAIPSNAIASRFDPREGEIFFIHGYPGVRARWSALFGGIMAKTFPYATARAPLPDIPADYDPEYHFALELPDDIWQFGGQSEIRPDPRGLSGSIVWDTGYGQQGLVYGHHPKRLSAGWCGRTSRNTIALLRRRFNTFARLC